MVKFKLTGHKELLRKLNSLDRKMKRSISGKALRVGAKVTVRALRAAAPVDTRKGRKSIGTKIKAYRNVSAAITGERVTVKREGKKIKSRVGAPHFHLIEYGTGERFHTGQRAASKVGGERERTRARQLRTIQASINKLGSAGHLLGKFAAKAFHKKRTGRVPARPFFQRAWRSSLGAAQAAQIAVLRREIEAVARGRA